jgi:hypothetical protein
MKRIANLLLALGAFLLVSPPVVLIAIILWVNSLIWLGVIPRHPPDQEAIALRTVPRVLMGASVCVAGVEIIILGGVLRLISSFFKKRNSN